MQNKQLFALLVFALFSFGAVNAQLQVRGLVYSEGPIQISLSVETYSETQFLFLNVEGDIAKDSGDFFRTKYDLPWEVVKDYNHTIKFTDGTVEKILFIDGTVPEDVEPKQKLIIDIDLINPETADMMLVVFWSLADNKYVILPYAELEEIRRRCVDPSVFNGNILLELVSKE